MLAANNMPVYIRNVNTPVIFILLIIKATNTETYMIMLAKNPFLRLNKNAVMVAKVIISINIVIGKPIKITKYDTYAVINKVNPSTNVMLTVFIALNHISCYIKY